MKKKTLIILVVSVLIIAGLTIFGAVKFNSFMERETTKGIKVTGAVSSVTHETQQDSRGSTKVSTIAYITFTAADGQNYKFKSNYTTSSMQKGDTFIVYYDPQNPSDTAHVYIKGFGFTFILILLVALVIYVGVPVGIVVGVIIFYKKHKVDDLRSKWTPVKAAVTVIYNGRGELNNYQALEDYLFVEAVDESGRVYKTGYKPGIHKIKENDVVTVYVNPSDPSKYFIDVLPIINTL